MSCGVVPNGFNSYNPRITTEGVLKAVRLSG